MTIHLWHDWDMVDRVTLKSDSGITVYLGIERCRDCPRIRIRPMNHTYDARVGVYVI